MKRKLNWFSWICLSGLIITLFLSVFIKPEVKAVSGGPYQGRLTGVNWFGFETGNAVAHGLWARDYKSVLQQIRDLGFNCIRLPWCNDMLTKTPNSIQINAHGVDPYTKQTGLNLDLEGLSSLEVMDKIIAEADRLGLMIILDNHSRQADGYMNETLWYTSKTSEAKWIEDWVFLAKRYLKYDNVVGFDLNNEPHGNLGTGMKPPASWGYDVEGWGNTDWKAAAERCGVEILKVNPNALIIVEGVEEYRGTNYWWGGNLQGVRDYPITKIPKANLMYSPHEYGPEVHNQSWFSAPDFPNNMYKIWDDNFWFIAKENIAPIFLGEFGIKGESAADPSSVAYKWFTTLMEYVGKKCSWTFWCMNPNSGDTGGILLNDWVTVDQAKYNLIKPYLEPLGSLPTQKPTQLPTQTPPPTGSFGPSPTGNVTPTPTVPQSTGNCSVTYTQNDWGSGATVSITIKNNGTTAINNWTLTWDFNGNQKITNLWNGTYTQSGTGVTVKNNEYNGVIAPNGGSVSFGFNLSYSGSNPKPVSFTLNGIVCTVE
ncbi:MAG TPA: cellulase family glycosylhydrolase [Bacillota bacterium]